MSVASFQQRFWRELWAPDGGSGSPWSRQPGWAVYRNTVLKGCVDNLLALYPALRRLGGDDWLAALALDYARAHPPVDARMACYGDGLPDFVAQALPAGDWPWLPEVAWLDALWNQCHVAADAPLLPPAALAGLQAADLPVTVLQPHPAARWRACAQWPAFALWQAAREAWPDPNPARWHGQGALLTRPGHDVLAHEVGLGACALLDACAQGQPVTVAAAHALTVEPGLDLGATLGCLLARGAFTTTVTTSS